MPQFNYIATSKQNTIQKGSLTAHSEKEARLLLREKKLTPLQLKEAKTQFSWLSFLRRKKTISTKDLALITRQLATLLNAGIPLEEAIHSVAEQHSNNFHIKTLCLAIRNKILEGYSFANALKDFPETFSNLYSATVSAGEKTGHLDKILERLAVYTEKQAFIKQKIQHALIYPFLMCFVSAGILGFLLTYVVPKMVSVYDSTNVTLPLITTLLISISNFFQHYGIFLFLILIIALYFLRYNIKKNNVLRMKWDALLLKIPFLNNSIKTINTARFSQTFSILSAAGIAVLEAMSIAATVTTSLPIQAAILHAKEQVREGGAIHLALKQTNFFNAMSIQLIASGEGTGQLDTMFERVAQQQENNIINLIETGLKLLEPIIILIMGGIILFIVLAVLLPIFQLDQLIQ